MLNLNRATIIGHVTQDPELRTTPNGQSVVNFSVATNRRWTSREGEQQEEAEFHDIVAWRKLAEICEQILSKGDLVYIDGRLQTRSWEAQDGSKRQKTEIVADNMINLERKQGGKMDQTSSKKNVDQTKDQEEEVDQRPEDEKEEPSSEDDEEEIDIDDIPL